MIERNGKYTELSDVLQSIDLKQWLENNKKLRYEAIEIEA